MDIFVEQIVKKKFGAMDYLIFAGTILGGIIIILASMIVKALAPFSIFILAGACFGIYYVFTSRNLEYEYSVTNSDVTVDKIINRSRRKRVVSFDAHATEEMGKYDPTKHEGKAYEKRLFVGNIDDGQDVWYMTFRKADFGYTLLVFNPEEKVLTAIKPFLPRQVAHDAFGRN